MIRNREDMEILLAEFEKRLEKANNEINECPQGSLVQVKRDGKMTYFQVIKQEGRAKRIAINKRQDIIQELARKKYLETEIKILQHDIHAIDKFLQGYQDISADNILARLPDRYRQLPEEYFFRRDKEHFSSEEIRQWAEAPFEQSTYMPWLKDKTTASGLKVRSKSEVIIAEKLDHYGIPYRYEEMLYIENQPFSPDFTILTRDGLRYWEHCGKVDDPTYIWKHNRKLSMYQKAGIVPWKNLIITYDDENGGIDTRIINSEIRIKLL